MAITREFMDWNPAAPMLGRAARWLIDLAMRKCAGNGQVRELIDQSAITVVTPGGRAGRRLLELLVEQAGAAALSPPRCITIGALPEYLYRASTDIADDLTSSLALTEALRSMDGDALRPFVPHPPKPDQWSAWHALAERIAGVYAELAAANVSLGEAIERLNDKLPGGLSLHDAERWQALSAVHDLYKDLLQSHDLIDRHTARRNALENGDCKIDRDLVLLGVTDMSPLVVAMLDQVAGHGGTAKVHALIHAPQSFADAFDDRGGLRMDRKVEDDPPLEVPVDRVRIVDRPRDQAMESLRYLGEISKNNEWTIEDVTIGLGDETLAATVQRTYELAGVPVHRPTGRALSHTPPVMLLRAFSDFLHDLSIPAFAALLRHPDIDAFIRSIDKEASSKSEDSEKGDKAVKHWLTLLDEFIADTYARKAAAIPALSDRRALKAVFDSVMQLFPENLDHAAPLHEWARVVRELLMHIYGRRRLNEYDPADKIILQSLEAIGDVLRSWRGLSTDLSFIPSMTLAQALRFAVNQLRGAHTTEESRGPSVELLGYLELPLDDAPSLIMTGCNEGMIPQSHNADPLLTDTVRRTLGMADNHRRYLRDRMAMRSILASRRNVLMIAGRRDISDDPLRPSRLLLECDAASLPQRVLDFYPKDVTEPTIHPGLTLMTPGESSGFIIPLPGSSHEPLTRYSVTSFRTFLKSPYRFYLKYVCRLETVDDAATEMDGGSFGTLAHEVLSAFGVGPEANQTNAEKINAFLDAELDRLATQKFGEEPPMAVRVQMEQLRRRLEKFAHVQAAAAAEGWRIIPEHIERKHEAHQTISGRDVIISGKIDRIDIHGDLGYRVIDYKTGNRKKSPREQHGVPSKGIPDEDGWKDLQLPLYDLFARQMFAGDDVCLAYAQLPKKLDHIGFDPVDWQQEVTDHGIDRARRIIEQVLSGEFWPVGDPNEYDGFAGICMDECLTREAVIELLNRQWEARKGVAGER